MNINNSKIASLLQDARWEIIEKEIEDIIKQIQEETPKADTEFQTLWNLAHKEGQISGIKLLIKRLNDKANAQI